MVELGKESVGVSPVALPTEKGSGKIVNTAAYRIKEVLSVMMVGIILGGAAVGLPSSAILSIFKPELGVYSLIPSVVGVVVGASVALKAGLKHQSQPSG